MRKVFSFLNIKRKYSVGEVVIDIDYTHRMPDYARDHKYYDKFLPCIVPFLHKNQIVIEVGANVGYTLISMANINNSLEYICYEADDSCFTDLNKNIETLKKINKNLKVTAIKQFIGLDINNVSLEHYGGSNHAVPDSGEIKSKSLDDSFLSLGLDESRCGLIICDVDGYDWDVIRSSSNIIRHNPYLYFECYCGDKIQLKNYKELFKELLENGYEGFSFFDNFGQFIFNARNLDEINNMLDYVAKQNIYSSSRTIFYYDIFAYPLDKVHEVSEILNEYNSL